jgi:hypothetical protein
MTELTAEQWAAYRNYADHVLVAIAGIEMPDEDFGACEYLILSHGANWSQDWLVREVSEIAISRDEGGAPVATPHILQVRSTNFEWGPSSAAYEIILLISTWAATSAAWDATKLLARKLYERLAEAERIAGDAIKPSEMEIENRAKWLIASRYQENSPTLKLESLEYTNDSSKFTVVIVAESGWTYELELEWVDEVVVVARVKRTQR